MLALSLIQACVSADAAGNNHAGFGTVRFIGQAVLPTGYMFKGTEVGGLSGLTYDHEKEIYFAISDDKGYKHRPRFYSVKIDLSTGRLTDESIHFEDVTFLRDGNNAFYEPGTVDFEGISVAGDGNVFLSSEAANGPLLAKFSRNGRFITSIQVPEKFLPDADETKGIRHNLGFESLTISRDGRTLTTAIENALVQDGPPATTQNNTSCRLITYDLDKESPLGEKLYLTDKLDSLDDEPDKQVVSGLVELLSTPDDHIYLALERTYTAATGHIIKLYSIDTGESTDISSIIGLSDRQHRATIKPVAKQLILNFNELGIPVDNIEGMTFGPQLPDGTRSLIFISDNNFNPEQFTQILAFSLY